MNIIVDSREQKPYWTEPDCFRTGLCIGDYTTEVLENKYHIERKSLMDLYGTITKGHLRFRNEFIRAWDKRIRFSIFVEGTKEEFKGMQWPGAHRLRMNGEHLIKIIDSMEKRYKLDIVWCKNRADTMTKVVKRLKKEEKLDNGRKRFPRIAKVMEQARQKKLHAKQLRDEKKKAHIQKDGRNLRRDKRGKRPERKRGKRRRK